ncbi:MAG: thioredoxin family protein, partial [Vulcanimicrobiota bacterium]
QVLDGSNLIVKASPDSQAPLEKLSGVLSVEGRGVQFEASIAVAAAPPAEPAGVGTVLFTLAAAFVGGLVLNLMPCVFPVLSLKVLGIVEQSRSEGRAAWHHGIVFGVGVLVSFWVMSGLLLAVRAAGQEVGWGYHLQNPVMIGFLAILFLLIGLNLFGVFEVGENLTQLSGVADQKKGFAGSFWSGVLTTLAATPCTAPFMGGAVGFALSQPAWVALLIFSALALGVAAPYMTLTLFPALLEKLPAPGAWMVTFKQILAFPMLLAMVWLVWVFGSQTGNDRMALLLIALLGVSFASWLFGKWGCSFEPRVKIKGNVAAGLVMVLSLYTAYTASQEPLGKELWQPYSPELVARLKSEGKPFFLDFTADWCTSCKANEFVALTDKEVLQKFQDLEVVMVKGDWTKKDPVITNALAEFQRAGVPLYVLYPGQDAEPLVLPEILFPGTVLEALEKVNSTANDTP